MLLKISIIVPIYNSEIYLSECLNSIINQTYKELEIILVNDGSTDGSQKICENFSFIDDRIILISKKNGGLSSARNAGLDVAKGDYISFVDSDDTISKELYQQNVSMLYAYNSIDVLQFPIYMNFGLDCASLVIKEKGFIKTKELLFKNWIEKNRISWGVCNKLFKKEIFNNLRFEVGMIYEDNYMTADILSKINNLFISEKGIYYYHLRENSITTSQHSLQKDLDTQKVSLHILDKIKNLENNKNGKIIILSRLFNVYQSLFYNFNYKKGLNTSFLEELKKINLFDLIKSNIAVAQKIKLIAAKLFGFNLFLVSKK